MSQHVGGKLILSKIIVVDSHIRYLNNWINKRIFIFISELNILYYIKLFKCHDSMILIYVLYFLYSNQLYNSYKYYICVISSSSCLRVILVYRYIRLSSILLDYDIAIQASIDFPYNYNCTLLLLKQYRV